MQTLSCFLAGVLADADDEETDRDERENPREADDYSPVDLFAFNAPSSGEDVSQRLDGVRLRQDIGDVAQIDGHTFHGPQHSAEQQIRVEAAQ